MLTLEGIGEQKGALVAPISILGTIIGLTLATTAFAAPIEESRIPTLADKTMEKYGNIINVAALLHDEDSLLIASVIVVESEGNPQATSRVGAHGLMQLMPATARAMGARNTSDPMDNILAGTKYIKHLREDYGFTRDEALVAYNMGPTRAKRWLSQYEATDFIYTRRVLSVLAYLEEEKERKDKLAVKGRDETQIQLATIKRALAIITENARPLLTRPQNLSTASLPVAMRSDPAISVVSE